MILGAAISLRTPNGDNPLFGVGNRWAPSLRLSSDPFDVPIPQNRLALETRGGTGQEFGGIGGELSGSGASVEVNRPRSLMERHRDSTSDNAGSIPAEAAKPKEIFERGSWNIAPDGVARQVVSALDALLINVSADELLMFTHRLHLQFTLSCDAKGKHYCRIFQNTRDTEGLIVKVVEYGCGGNSPMSALRNSIAMFLVSEPDDFHKFMNAAWPDKAPPAIP